ncbi:hypothetical protein M413DRAFT_32590 [Hebeloma cylindrosporum]|uniref:Protein kinase domain-containing protein n=1 Tax=Hebeloma cylindrosporum TaxID=76867 RepID=A0A0C2XBL0_HEBCY|nr:hypothetical protein M413DRAFT_32590 [Hebeloma cylindrosporum h7]
MSTTSVLLADETGFHPALEKFFDMKYPTTLVDGTSILSPKTSQPLEFPDRHLDPFLSIKYVKPMGFSISEYLSEFCEAEVMDFVRNKQPLRTGRGFRVGRVPGQKTLSSAYEVGTYYVQNIGERAAGFPSRLYLRPSDEDWNSFIAISPPAPMFPGVQEETFKKSTTVYLFDEEEMCRFRPPPNDELVSEMKRLGDKYSQLAVYEFYDFSETARRLLEDMGRQEGFEWTTSGTGGYIMDIAPRELPPDGTEGIWSKISSTQSGKKPKGKERRLTTTLTKRTNARLRMENIVRAAARKGTRGKPYTPVAKDFLQKAWIRAVEVDATFLVFHCGKAERIGFRHRETQTLYLSEIIDPSVIEKYAKIQTGLHLAIAKDVLERDVLSSTKKRPAEPTDAESSSKRRRTTHETDDDSNPSGELLAKSLGSRNLALISLDQGLYRSPVPSSFVRVESTWDPVHHTDVDKELRRKARYSSSEYFTLILGDPMGSGAVGLVYKASATFRSGSKSFAHARLAVKLAFLERQRALLRHEYAMYKLLASRGITENILPVYGLFQDAETGILGLAMEYGGESVTCRKSEKTRQVSFTKQERTTIMNAFHQLHGVGILHGDIRLNNILLHSSGAVYVIDLDQAKVDPEKKQLKKEMDELALLLSNGDNAGDPDTN